MEGAGQAGTIPAVPGGVQSGVTVAPRSRVHVQSFQVECLGKVQAGVEWSDDVAIYPLGEALLGMPQGMP